MAGTGFLRIDGGLLRIAAARESGRRFKPFETRDGRLADGQLLPVGRAIERYKEAIEKNPDSLVDTLSLATATRRWDAAARLRSVFQRCLVMDPTCPESRLWSRPYLHDSGRREDAFQVLDEP